MVQEATILNKEFIDLKKACFRQASIEKLPFNENTFDCITTTNTLYFWPQPKDNAKELLRVLKPGGKLLIAYRGKKFMDKIELSKYGFKKYLDEDVKTLLKYSGFNNIETQIIKEPDLDFEGKPFKMEGYYTLAKK